MKSLIKRLIVLPLLLMTLLGLIVALMLAHSSVAVWLTLAAVALIALLSLSPVADALLRPLEQAYARFDPSAQTEAPSPAYIAVVASGFASDAGARGVARLSNTSMVRLVEGIRLLGCFADTQLLVCSYTPEPDGERIDAMAEAAIELGVSPQRLRSVPAEYSSLGEMEAFSKLADRAPLLLVTSASHMPRLMRLAADVGVDAHAAPTDFLTAFKDSYGPWRWLPHSRDLAKSERALYEYLARFAERRGGD